MNSKQIRENSAIPEMMKAMEHTCPMCPVLT